MQRERMQTDVLVVGAGPAGLACAIHLKQCNAQLQVCVLEKAAQAGAHTLSGAVIDPRGLDELIADWREIAPLKQQVSSEQFAYLTEKKRHTLPNWLLPKCLKNPRSYVGSLGNLVAWLAQYAEDMGVQIFCGYSAAQLLIENDRVCGVITGDMGVGKDGAPTEHYQPGIELRASYSVFAEGCRGSLGRQLEKTYNLRKNSSPQAYALGIKELWRLPSELHKAGRIEHTVGWPLDNATYGGGFLYQYGDRLMSIGMVIGLDYRNPYFSPYEEFQRWKQHPSIRPLLQSASRIAYGARSIAAGGLQSLPKLSFPGGVLIGCEAGFLHAARLKGTHTAIKSGLLAARAIADELREQTADNGVLQRYDESVRASWIYRELYPTRNFKPWLSKGLWTGGFLFACEQLVAGRVPWTLSNRQSHRLNSAASSRQIAYQPADGVVSFDRLESVYLSNTSHSDNQPSHLHLIVPEQAIACNWNMYRSPEVRYCPAAVYETDGKTLRINAQNCLHCKACDIKDPGQNIVWKPPQGGEGPLYQGM